MGKSQAIIPITSAGSSCSSAASCPSSSSCSSAGGAAADNADPAFRLQQAGWVLRTTIGEPRLSEVVENYRAMGYEVHVEPFGTDRSSGEGGASCTTCYDAADKSNASQAWGSVYVRLGQVVNRDDDLF